MKFGAQYFEIEGLANYYCDHLIFAGFGPAFHWLDAFQDQDVPILNYPLKLFPFFNLESLRKWHWNNRIKRLIRRPVNSLNFRLVSHFTLLI